MSPGLARPPLLPGATVLDRGGVRLGRVMHLFHDPATAEPGWASVAPSDAGQWLLVPLAGSVMTPAGIVLAHPGATVLTGPAAPGGELLPYRDLVAATTHYYGPDSGEQPATGGGGPNTTPPPPQDPTPSATPAAAPVTVHDEPGGVVLTRSEERLRTRTETVVAQRVRVRKVVVTEERTITVQVRREELRIETVPADDPTPVPGDLATVAPRGGDDLVLTLHTEHPAITTRVVPVERVRISTHVVTEDHTVRAPVRREVVDAPAPGLDRAAPPS